jgi:3-hydroxyisobutyrate dehydrogenase-like beta-hydroxyacid dehydrogenase
MALVKGLDLCKREGLSQQMLLDVLRRSPHFSLSIETKAVQMIEKNFSPAVGKIGFRLKDVQLMLDLGKRLNFPLPLISFHAQALTAEVAKARDDCDNSDIVPFYEDPANLQPRHDRPHQTRRRRIKRNR